MSIEEAIRAIVVEEIQKYMNQGVAAPAQPAITPAAPPVTAPAPAAAPTPAPVPPGPPASAAPPAPGAPPAPAATPPMAPGAPAPAPTPAAPSAPAAHVDTGITLDQIRDKLNTWWRAHPDRSGEIMVILGEIGVQKVDDIPPAQFGTVWQKLEALGG